MLTRSKIFWIDVHANSKRTLKSLILSVVESKARKTVAFLSPKLVIIVEMPFPMIQQQHTVSI